MEWNGGPPKPVLKSDHGSKSIRTLKPHSRPGQKSSAIAIWPRRTTILTSVVITILSAHYATSYYDPDGAFMTLEFPDFRVEKVRLKSYECCHSEAESRQPPECSEFARWRQTRVHKLGILGEYWLILCDCNFRDVSVMIPWCFRVFVSTQEQQWPFQLQLGARVNWQRIFTLPSDFHSS